MNNMEPITSYLSGKPIDSTNQLPVPYSDRARTDIFCTIATSLFAVALFVLACIQLNRERLNHMTYPTDGMGRKCTLDNPNYNLLYFTSAHDPTKRVCVSQCPKSDQEQSLKCWPTEQISCSRNQNPQYQVQIYASYQQQTRLGLFCVPQDQTLQNKILQNSGLRDRFNFIEYQDLLFISMGVAFGLGILFLVMLRFITGPTVYIAIFLGGLSCILSSIFILINIGKFHDATKFLLIVFCVILIFFGIFIILAGLFRRNDIQLCIEYLKQGMGVLSSQKGLLLLILVFIVLMIGLFALCLFQIYSYWSSSQLYFENTNVYYEPRGTFASVTKILVIIQLIWGFCFLKQAFSFLVQACAVTYYYTGKSQFMFGLRGLLCYHWGSVVAASFLLNFFYLFDVVYDIIKPSESNYKFYQCFTGVCCCCDRILGFVRSEAMAFINLTGLPYCNSARWIERINYLSTYFDGSQSINRYFKIGAHVLLSLIATIAVFFSHIVNGNGDVYSFGIVFSFILNLFIVTFFISLASDLAEGILTCRLVEQYLKGQNMHQDYAKNYKTVNYEDYNKESNRFDQSNVNEGYQVLPTQNY